MNGYALIKKQRQYNVVPFCQARETIRDMTYEGLEVKKRTTLYMNGENANHCKFISYLRKLELIMQQILLAMVPMPSNSDRRDGSAPQNQT
jgi:hypothetical protein